MDVFSRCDHQNRSILRNWSHLLKKTLVENFLCSMSVNFWNQIEKFVNVAQFLLCLLFTLKQLPKLNLNIANEVLKMRKDIEFQKFISCCRPVKTERRDGGLQPPSPPTRFLLNSIFYKLKKKCCWNSSKFIDICNTNIKLNTRDGISCQ